MDDKRFLRQLKKQIKQQGNRKRRRYLKNVTSEPDEFDFGAERSSTLNEPRRQRQPEDEGEAE